MSRYDTKGYAIRDGVKDTSEIKRMAEKIRLQDEERARNANGWARLCGSVPLIGGPSGR
jgi:hypothetical protein